MTDEWSKYKRILDREDEEFKKAMEAKVCISMFSEFSSKYRISAGARYYSPESIKFCNFQVILISSSMMVVRFMSFHIILGFGS